MGTHSAEEPHPVKKGAGYPTTLSSLLFPSLPPPTPFPFLSTLNRQLTILPVTIRLQPIGAAPHLKQRVFKLSANQRFEVIVRQLRKKLAVRESESVYCYIGNVFSPSLDEVVANLWSVSVFPFLSLFLFSFFSLFRGCKAKGALAEGGMKCVRG